MLVYSIQEYANGTIPAHNLVLWQKLRTSEGKNLQSLPKDECIGNLHCFLDKNL